MFMLIECFVGQQAFYVALLLNELVIVTPLNTLTKMKYFQSNRYGIGVMIADGGRLVLK